MPAGVRGAEGLAEGVWSRKWVFWEQLRLVMQASEAELTGLLELSPGPQGLRSQKPSCPLWLCPWYSPALFPGACIPPTRALGELRGGSSEGV